MTNDPNSRRRLKETMIGTRSSFDFSDRVKYLSGLTMKELAKLTGAIELDAFCSTYNHPFLIQIANLKSKKSGQRLLSTTDQSLLASNALEYDLTDCPVFFVDKDKEAGASPGQIEVSIGRGKVNDITLDYPTVSKQHAFIRVDKSRYFITDNNSKNGTFLGETRLEPHREVPLSMGQTIDFSENLSFLFLGPSIVFTYLKNVTRR